MPRSTRRARGRRAATGSFRLKRNDDGKGRPVPWLHGVETDESFFDQLRDRWRVERDEMAGALEAVPELIDLPVFQQQVGDIATSEEIVDQRVELARLEV